MTKLKPPPPPSNVFPPAPPPPVFRCRRSPFILSHVAKAEFGSSVNIQAAPKEEVDAITCAARIRYIARSVGTNMTQGTETTTTTGKDDTNPTMIPADIEEMDAIGYPTDTLLIEYYCFYTDLPKYITKSTNEVPNIHLKENSACSSLALCITPKQPAAGFIYLPIKRSQPPNLLPKQPTCLTKDLTLMSTSLIPPTTPLGISSRFMSEFSRPFASSFGAAWIFTEGRG